MCAVDAPLRLPQLAAMRKMQSSHTSTLRALNVGIGYMAQLMMSTRYALQSATVQFRQQSLDCDTAIVWAHWVPEPHIAAWFL